MAVGICGSEQSSIIIHPSRISELDRDTGEGGWSCRTWMTWEEVAFEVQVSAAAKSLLMFSGRSSECMKLAANQI